MTNLSISPISVDEQDLGVWFATDNAALTDPTQLCLAVIDLAAIYGLDTADLWIRTCESPVYSVMFVESLTLALANTPWLAIHNALSKKDYPDFDIFEFVCSMSQAAVNFLNNLISEEYIFDFGFCEDTKTWFFGLFSSECDCEECGN